MDDIKLFAKMKKNWRPIQNIRIYSQDIGMEFAMLIMKSGKREIMKRIKLPNQEEPECLEKRKISTAWEY